MGPFGWHTAFELSAYFVGMRLFLWQRKQLALPVLADRDRSLWIGIAAICGAAIGAKLGYWIEDPLNAFADFPAWRHLLEGKTIVGALLGGLIGVEAVKRAIGAQGSSGDAFVLPLIAGIAIGRVGCFLSGLADHTYGNPTQLPCGVDFGDGTPDRDESALGTQELQMVLADDAVRYGLAGASGRIRSLDISMDSRHWHITHRCR